MGILFCFFLCYFIALIISPIISKFCSYNKRSFFFLKRFCPFIKLIRIFCLHSMYTIGYILYQPLFKLTFNSYISHLYKFYSYYIAFNLICKDSLSETFNPPIVISLCTPLKFPHITCSIVY